MQWCYVTRADAVVRLETISLEHVQAQMRTEDWSTPEGLNAVLRYLGPMYGTVSSLHIKIPGVGFIFQIINGYGWVRVFDLLKTLLRARPFLNCPYEGHVILIGQLDWLNHYLGSYPRPRALPPI